MTKSTSNVPGHQYPQQEGSKQQGGYDISEYLECSVWDLIKSETIKRQNKQNAKLK